MVQLRLVPGTRAGSELSPQPGGSPGSGRGPQADAASLRLCAGLEEAVVAGGAGVGAGLGFWLARLGSSEGPRERLAALVAPRTWSRERGRWLARGALRFGVAPERLLVVRPRTEAETLWALEEVLRSGAVDLAIGAPAGASLTQTRRLDMAARASGATAALLRVCPDAAAPWPLSAARRRWRVTALPSGPHPWDPRAPGAPRWRAELARRRDGPPGSWDLEWNDETRRLDLVDGLAGDGLGQAPRAVASG